MFGLAIGACVVATLLVLLPGVHGHAIMPTVDLVIDTVAAVVCISLTALAWARFRERHVIVAAYHASAFLALAVAYGIAVLISLQQGASIGSLAEPEDVQVLVFAIAHLAAAVLFVLAGVFTARRTYGWNPPWLLAAPTLAVLLAGLVGHWLYPPPAVLEIIQFTDASGLPRSRRSGLSSTW